MVGVDGIEGGMPSSEARIEAGSDHGEENSSRFTALTRTLWV